jgi:hypothetical protein
MSYEYFGELRAPNLSNDGEYRDRLPRSNSKRVRADEACGRAAERYQETHSSAGASPSRDIAAFASFARVTSGATRKAALLLFS